MGCGQTEATRVVEGCGGVDGEANRPTYVGRVVVVVGRPQAEHEKHFGLTPPGDG